MGYLVIALLQISLRMWQWKNCENRPVFDEVVCNYSRWLTFLAHSVLSFCWQKLQHWHSRNSEEFDSERFLSCGFIYATADEAVAYIYIFFCFFSVRKNMRQPFSGTAERIFMKLLPNDTGENGVCNIVPPPGEWRMLMICVNYAMTLAQSPEGATHGGCVIKSWAREWI